MCHAKQIMIRGVKVSGGGRVYDTVSYLGGTEEDEGVLASCGDKAKYHISSPVPRRVCCSIEVN